MIGAGKSTTTERLAAELTSRGEDVRAFLELRTIIRSGRDTSTVCAAAPASDAKEYDPGQWDALADRCARGAETVIVESTFLQNSVMPHFLDDAPVAVVKEVFADLAARIAPTAPLLVYLRPSDVADAIRRVHAERGEPWSSRNYAFVSACPGRGGAACVGERGGDRALPGVGAVVDELVSIVESLLIVDPQQDWAGALERILDAVSVRRSDRSGLSGVTPRSPSGLRYCQIVTGRQKVSDLGLPATASVLSVQDADGARP